MGGVEWEREPLRVGHQFDWTECTGHRWGWNYMAIRKCHPHGRPLTVQHSLAVRRRREHPCPGRTALRTSQPVETSTGLFRSSVSARRNDCGRRVSLRREEEAYPGGGIFIRSGGTDGRTETAPGQAAFDAARAPGAGLSPHR